jgi:hypothetical protein
MTFDPQASRAAAGDPATGLALAKVPPEVLAKVGETFAAGAFELQRQIGSLATAARDKRGAILRAARDELARLEHLGVQVQQVARVLSGEGQATVESFDLAAAARQTLTEWAASAQRGGVRLEGPTEPLFVQAVPAVIEQLLDLALDYAMRIGTRIEVGAAMQGEPARPMLTLHVACAEAHGGGNDFDDLHWQLFVLLARACHLSAQRVAAGRAVMLMLGFATRDNADPAAVRPAKLLERTTMPDGRHALLLEPRDPTRLQAHRLLLAAGLKVDAAATLEQAHAALRDRRPDTLITGVPISEPGCAALIDALRAMQPRLRVIELVDDDSAFALSVPGSDQPGRVGRRDLARTLVSAVSQELDTALEA